MDGVRRNMQALRITPEDAQDITFWKSRIRAADPHLVGKGEDEEEVNAVNLSLTGVSVRVHQPA